MEFEAIVAALIVVLAFASIAYGFFELNQLRRQWKLAASLVDLSYHMGGLFSGPWLKGEISERPVKVLIAPELHAKVSLRKTSAGAHHATLYYTTVKVRSRGQWCEKIEITSRKFDRGAEYGGDGDENFFRRMRATGDDNFDDHFRVEGNITPQILEWLRTDSCQEALLRLESTFNFVRASDGIVEVAVIDRVSDGIQLARLVRQAVEVVIELDEYAEPSDKSATTQKDGPASDELFPQIASKSASRSTGSAQPDLVDTAQ